MKKSRLIGASCAVVFSFISMSSQAALVDNGTVTHDTVSGLDWLDLTLSADRSYNDVSVNFGVGGDFEGYRYATETEITAFFDSAGGIGPYQGETHPVNESWIDDILQMWGITGDQPGFNVNSQWMYGVPIAGVMDTGIVQQWYGGNYSRAEFGHGTKSVSYVRSQFGSALVSLNVPDTDGDGVSDDTDNCPAIVNPLQGNNDSDALGDVCDPDDDNDGTDDVADNCPIDGNPDQADFDYDGLGDACDTTIDAGGIAQHVEDKVAEIVQIISALNVSGGNGMIKKLTGNGGVIKKMSSAISAFNGGYIDIETYVSELDGALSMLDAFDNQITAKAGKPKGINDPELTQIQDASAEIRATIDNLKVAAGG
jgi:hypothetical protein